MAKKLWKSSLRLAKKLMRRHWKIIAIGLAMVVVVKNPDELMKPALGIIICFFLLKWVVKNIRNTLKW